MGDVGEPVRRFTVVPRTEPVPKPMPKPVPKPEKESTE